MTDVPVRKIPLLYCTDQPTFPSGLSDEIQLPFGLPPVTLPDTCDDLIEALSNMLSSLSFLNPVIKIAGCILSVIDVLKAIPDAIGSLNPGKITEALEKLGECVIFLSNLTMLTPTAVTEMLNMIRGIVDAIIKTLSCIVFMMSALIEATSEAEEMSQSPEESIRDMGACLREENERLEKTLRDRLKGLQALIILINVLLAVIGPLIGMPDAQLPSLDGTPVSADGVNVLRDIVEVLTEIRRAIP